MFSRSRLSIVELTLISRKVLANPALCVTVPNIYPALRHHTRGSVGLATHPVHKQRRSQATVSWQPWEPKGDGLDAQPWRVVKGKPAKAAPLGMIQSENPLVGDEEETAPPLESGGFFRFAGELNTDKTTRAKVGGFCGTRPPRRHQPLQLPDGYEGVEIRIRTDGRLYEVNFEPQSGIINDLYKGYLRTPPGEWTTLALPLKRFILTGQGQIRDIQRKWDRHMELRSIGFTIADSMGGPFQLDVAWIALVSKVDAENEIDENGQRQRKKPSRPKNGVMTW